MAYAYTWSNAEQTSLKRVDDNGNVAFVPVADGNRDYAEFVSSGVYAGAYVAPAAVVDSRTDVEKLEEATGLTLAEIKTALGI